MKIQITQRLSLVVLILCTAVLVIMAGCTTQTPTQSQQNQQPVEVTSVLGPVPPYNPGGPTIAITLKNAGVEPVIFLKATLKLERDFEFDFINVTPANPLLPGESSNQTLNLIGPQGNFTGDISYPLTINVALQSGTELVYTKQVQIMAPSNN